MRGDTLTERGWGGTGKASKRGWYFELGLEERIALPQVDIAGIGVLGRKENLSKGPEAGK